MQDIYKGGLAAEPVLYCIYNMPDFHKKIKAPELYFLFSEFSCIVTFPNTNPFRLSRTTAFSSIPASLYSLASCIINFTTCRFSARFFTLPNASTYTSMVLNSDGMSSIFVPSFWIFVNRIVVSLPCSCLVSFCKFVSESVEQELRFHVQ